MSDWNATDRECARLRAELATVTGEQYRKQLQLGLCNEIISRIDVDSCVPLQLLADGLISRRKCKEAIIQIASGVDIEDIPLPDLTTPGALAESETAVDLRAQLADVTRDRDLLRAALIDCAVPLEVLHAIDCDLAPATQAGITAAIAAIRSALFSAQPEPKPEAPKPHVITRDDLTKAGPG